MAVGTVIVKGLELQPRSVIQDCLLHSKVCQQLNPVRVNLLTLPQRPLERQRLMLSQIAKMQFNKLLKNSSGGGCVRMVWAIS